MIGIKISECEIVVNDCERVIILKLDKLEHIDGSNNIMDLETITFLDWDIG